MLRKFLGCACALLLAAPLSANATAITWSFQSTITGLSAGVAAQLGASSGDSLSFLLTFNNAAPVGGAGCLDQQAGLPNPDLCQYRDATLIFSDIRLNGVFIGSPQFEPQPPFPQVTPCGRNYNGFITVRNNGLDPGVGDTVDGLSFNRGVCDGPDYFDNFIVVLRGPVLDIFDDLSIPTNPDPRLADLRTSLFQYCAAPVAGGDCAENLDADITSISRVPEPATLGLLGLGLAGLGFTRRRRTH